MKQNRLIAATLIGGMMLLTAACVEEKKTDDYLRPVGSEIVFSATTTFDNSLGTRTVYTDRDQDNRPVDHFYSVDGSSTERIEWEATDRVNIVYRQQSSSPSEYEVTTVQNSTDENHYADVEPKGTKLVWQDNSSYEFYALYPTSNGKHPNSNATLTNYNHVAGYVPDGQSLGTYNNAQGKYLPDMAYAYMVAYADGTNVNGNRVTLPFRPAVTAFEFIFTMAEAIKITQFEMISDTNEGSVLAGNFNFDITTGDARGGLWTSVNTPDTTPKKHITVNFPTGGVDLAANATLDFTVFTLPVTQTGITLKFTCVKDGVTYTKSLPLKDKTTGTPWHSFAAAKKHIITNNPNLVEDVEYVLDANTSMEVSFTGGTGTYKVKSYKYVSGSNSSSKVPVSWTVKKYEVSLDGGVTWGTPTTTKPVFMTGFTVNGNGSVDFTSYNATLAPSDRLQNDALNTKTPIGSQNSPWDLSKHNPGATSGSEGTQRTSNCYVVSAPGWFKFPVYYGNLGSSGIVVNNAVPTNNFKNHVNNKIGSGYIHGQTNVSLSSAGLVWQDSPGLVKDIALSSDKHYVSFYVDQQTIAQGNAVIAVYDTNNQIAWSWHIWVTHHSMTAVTVRQKQFMEVNLGWCDAETVEFPNRQVRVTFVQSEPATNPKEKAIVFKQNPNSFSTTGNGPHYAWGRKDPMVPPIGDETLSGKEANKIWYDANGVASQNLPVHRGGMSIPDVIKNPMVVIHSTVDWSTTVENTLWNYNIRNKTASQLSQHGRVADFADLGHGKTVYDPCPAGYTVPNTEDVVRFATYDDGLPKIVFYSGSPYGTSGYSYSHTWDPDFGGVTINSNYWPADGMRAYSASSQYVDMVYEEGYYFTSVPYDDTYANRPNIQYAYILQFDHYYGLRISRGYAKASYRSIRCVPE